MFDFFKKKLAKNNKPAVEQKQSSTINENKKIIEVVSSNNSIQINILENCSLEEFVNASKDFNLDELTIPVRMYIKNGNNLNLSSQTIYVSKCNDSVYFISKNDKQIKISQQKIINEQIEEIVIEILRNTRDYKITKYIHDLNRSTISVKWFPQNNTEINFCSLGKKEAFVSIYKLLIDMKNNNIDQILLGDALNYQRLYTYFNLIPEGNYYPVIGNDTITLSWPCRFNETDVRKRDYEFFDIILNETKQVVGQISFDYRTSCGFSYGGNVSYNIKEEFRGNHYATMALSLLKELLKENLFSGDKDLYVATTPENYKSQKVALNNEGKLFYKGEVPEDDSINYIDGVKKVNVYRIKM